MHKLLHCLRGLLLSQRNMTTKDRQKLHRINQEEPRASTQHLTIVCRIIRTSNELGTNQWNTTIDLDKQSRTFVKEQKFASKNHKWDILVEIDIKRPDNWQIDWTILPVNYIGREIRLKQRLLQISFVLWFGCLTSLELRPRQRPDMTTYNKWFINKTIKLSLRGFNSADFGLWYFFSGPIAVRLWLLCPTEISQKTSFHIHLWLFRKTRLFQIVRYEV